MLSINLRFKKPFKKQLKNPKNIRSIDSNIYGRFFIKALEAGVITEKQIEAARRVISRLTKRKCKIWLLKTANKPVTAKPNEVRMGKGKGAVNQYVRYIKTGDVIFEINFTNTKLAVSALISASRKLPIKTMIA